jgi:hypothetical protein
MDNLRQDLPNEGPRARGVGILYTFGRGVSGFFTVEVEWLPFLECLPLDGWF